MDRPTSIENHFQVLHRKTQRHLTESARSWILYLGRDWIDTETEKFDLMCPVKWKSIYFVPRLYFWPTFVLAPYSRLKNFHDFFFYVYFYMRFALPYNLPLGATALEFLGSSNRHVAWIVERVRSFRVIFACLLCSLRHSNGTLFKNLFIPLTDRNFSVITRRNTKRATI